MYKNLPKRYDLLMAYAYDKNVLSSGFYKDNLIYIGKNHARATGLLKYYTIKKTYKIMAADCAAGKTYK